MGRAGWCAPKLISWLLTAPAESGSAVHRCGGGQVADGEGQHDERLDQDHLELAVLCDVRAGDAAAADVPRPKLRASRTGRGDGRCANPHLLLLLPPLSSANRSVPAARTLSREAAFAIRSWARRVDLRIGYGLNAGMMPAQPSSRREVQRVSAGCCDAVRNKMHAMYLRYSCTSAPRLRVRRAPSSAPMVLCQRPSRWASRAGISLGVAGAGSAPDHALSA